MTRDEALYEAEAQADELRWHDSWCIDGYWCPHADLLHPEAGQSDAVPAEHAAPSLRGW